MKKTKVHFRRYANEKGIACSLCRQFYSYIKSVSFPMIEFTRKKIERGILFWDIL